MILKLKSFWTTNIVFFFMIIIFTTRVIFKENFILSNEVLKGKQVISIIFNKLVSIFFFTVKFLTTLPDTVMYIYIYIYI